MRKNLLVLVTLGSLLVLILSGCASTPPKPFPSQYTQEDHEMSVAVVKITDEPIMRDSGAGGLIGVIVNANRASEMKKIFKGIEGGTVKEMLRQQISNKLESVFFIEEESEDLALEVTVTKWGWFLPTAAFGIKTGSYQLEIAGLVSVYSLKPEKKEITKFTAMSQRPLGDDPKTEDTQKALVGAIDDFSTQVVNFVLNSGS